MELQVSLLVIVSAFVISAGLVKALMPLLQRYALARPNARSSHSVPTPQGGGLAVVLAAIIVIILMSPRIAQRYQIDFLMSDPPFLLLYGVVGLAVVGMADDILQLGVVLRLCVQLLTACLIISELPVDLIAASPPSVLIVKIVLVVGLIWFINLTNFMDGIDGITVAQMVPVLIGIVLIAHFESRSPGRGLLSFDVPALALLGALLGFAPFNRHVAKVFLGDVGSLPIGALVGWLLINLAGRGHWAAATILPLYYLADATITLGRRWMRGESLAQAHRSHFYQLATQRGFSVPAVTGRIWALNGLLVVLALATVIRPTPIVTLAALGLAVLVTGWLLLLFERGQVPFRN